jgi:hypothetical protein
VVKCAGKFTPIPGFLHFSAMEVGALLSSIHTQSNHGKDHRLCPAKRIKVDKISLLAGVPTVGYRLGVGLGKSMMLKRVA